MVRLRSLCLALLVAGCGLDVASTTSALNSCNMDADCPVPGLSGKCVAAQCNNHECQYITDPIGCSSGCGSAADCVVNGACNAIPCSPADGSHANPWCNFNNYAATFGCACTTDASCSPNVCQQNPTCQTGTCTFAAKAPIGAPCCNVTLDCGGTASCASNVCSCTSQHKYCSGAAPGDGRCVPSTGCCVAGDCPAGNTCQARTCSAAGACGFQSNGNLGCCDPATVAGDCGGTATCVANTCSCAVGEKFCNGGAAGSGSCIPSTGCCAASDCPAHANATAACTSNACVYTCNSGFHDCSGVCKDDTSVASCGTSCSACPSGNGCQTATCTGGVCGFSGAGSSPCCSIVGDCTPANACQTATACTNNQCMFGSTGATGCCNSASDCAAPTEPCLQAACVANQCATTPVSGCTPDLSTPAPPDDLAVAVAPDLGGALSISGGGGCALGGAAPASPRALAVVAALLFLALALRRRRSA